VINAAEGAPHDDPDLIAVALVSKCTSSATRDCPGECGSRTGGGSDCADDDAYFTSLATIFIRTTYHEETGRT